MNSKSCVHNIENHLKDFDINISLEVDLKNKIITVRRDHPNEQDAGYLTEIA